jgi:hypothetical protein
MEAIKFVMFYGLEIVVVGVVVVTVLAGLYQLVRDKIRSRASTPSPETAKH